MLDQNSGVQAIARWKAQTLYSRHPIATPTTGRKKQLKRVEIVSVPNQHKIIFIKTVGNWRDANETRARQMRSDRVGWATLEIARRIICLCHKTRKVESKVGTHTHTIHRAPRPIVKLSYTCVEMAVCRYLVNWPPKII